MQNMLSLSRFSQEFMSDEACFEAIVALKYPKGIFCQKCRRITLHYKVKNRTSFLCKLCRRHIYPLRGTIFEKSTTPLTLWFYAMYLMTVTKGEVSAKQLERELGVTYKTAWRMYTILYSLMKQNKGDLLLQEATYLGGQTQSIIHRFTLFNKLEFRLVEKKEESNKK